MSDVSDLNAVRDVTPMGNVNVMSDASDTIVPQIAGSAFWVDDDSNAAVSPGIPDANGTWRLATLADYDAAHAARKALKEKQAADEAIVQATTATSTADTRASAAGKLAKLGFTVDEQNIIINGYASLTLSVQA